MLHKNNVPQSPNFCFEGPYILVISRSVGTEWGLFGLRRCSEGNSLNTVTKAINPKNQSNSLSSES